MSQQQGGRAGGSRLSVASTSLSRTTSQVPGSQNPPIAEKGVTLEQSVRKFRVVEALRGGDTASISKAIRETTETDTGGLDDTTILHLAIQCAEFPVVEYVISQGLGVSSVNARDKEGNTPLHVAATHGRTLVVKLLLEQKDINDAIANIHGKLAIDLARNPEIFQLLQLSRSLFADSKIKQVQELIGRGDYDALAVVLEEQRMKDVLDINSTEFVSESVTLSTGGTLLHEAARKKNAALIKVLLLHGADPFRRDRKGKLPQAITSDDNIKAILKKSPAAVAAQRGIQEKAVLGHAASQSMATGATADPFVGREAREMKGYLKKWTNYRKGYQLRWFVLEDGVLSYYKHQDDAGSACRGAINMKIARLHMTADEKTKFEIIGKSSVKYTLKANHEVEAKRWFWALNNSIQWTKDQAREEQRQNTRSAELLKHAKEHNGNMSIQDSRSEGPSLDLSRSHSHVPSRSVSSVKMNKGEFASPSTVGSHSEVDFGDAGADGDHGSRYHRGTGPHTIGDHEDDDDDDDEYGDGRSVREEPGATKDALNITAQSAKLQLETMSHVHNALVAEQGRNPNLLLADQMVYDALSTYDATIRSLSGLVGDLLRISKDRDAFWQYRLDRESNIRRMWEDSMAKVAHEQEILEARVGEAEEKRKIRKRALRDTKASEAAAAADDEGTPEQTGGEAPADSRRLRRKSTIAEQRAADLSDSELDDEEEFFDAVDAGDVLVTEMPPGETAQDASLVVTSGVDISSAFKGYENGIRHRLKIDDDNRPKVSLWVCLTFLTLCFRMGLTNSRPF